LDVIGRALTGDEGARAFLERTSSIYVLDVTDHANPKTYGCWNFIHQALNEIERYESNLIKTGATTTPPSALVHHVRLLASMALRVARRPPQGDRAIVATCISNASDYHCSPSQSQWLFDLNLELREIVMGRIAAMAFDFSFHRGGIAAATAASPANASGSSDHQHSAFADPVVMDTFNAILAANAVSTGPAAVRHFATEWIIPSSRSIPVSALLSIAHHLALEGKRPSSPAGTMDMLQQLSITITSMVLVPAMADAATDNSNEDELPSGDSQAGGGTHAGNSRILTKSLAALDIWCSATTLTLPQLKHISSKINLDIVDILNDVMYSDSPEVVDALADFVERVMESPFEQEISQERMNQVRHIINVNETAFKASFSPDQLKVIEQKEMAAILEQLVSAVGLQRIRFQERQNQGDVEVCRNLARIGKVVAAAWLEIYKNDRQVEPERGILEFLLKTAYHPSVNICGMTLSVIPSFCSPTNSLAKELIPLLQRKAIIPHVIKNDTGELSLLAADQYGTGVDEFLRFRDDVVADALATCWEFESEAYIDSCTSAIEEFCSVGANGDASTNLSFHLEAALFCVETLGGLLTSSASSESSAIPGKSPFAYANQFARCMAAVSQKTTSITTNPLTVTRLSLLLQRWTFWFHQAQQIGVATDLAAASLTCSLQLAEQPYAQALINDTNASPIQQSSLAFEELISVDTAHFSSTGTLGNLLKLWESVYVQRVSGKHRLISSKSIEPLGQGICTAILRVEVESVRNEAFDSLFAPPLRTIDELLILIRAATDQKRGNDLLELMGGEIELLAVLIGVCSTGKRRRESDAMDEGALTSNRTEIPFHLLSIVRRCWSSVEVLAKEFSSDSNIASSIGSLLKALIPVRLQQNEDMVRLRNLTAVVLSMLSATPSGPVNHEVFGQACEFLKTWIHLHGEEMELRSTSTASSEGCPDSDALFKTVLVQVIGKAEPCLGSSLTDLQVQGQGQPAFESRPAPLMEAEHSSFNCLGHLLDLIQDMQTICPSFWLSNDIQSSSASSSEPLIRRVASSSVIAISASDRTLAQSSIQFLITLCSQASSTADPDASKEAARTAVMENISRIRRGATSRLLMGCCGKFERTLVGPASVLLHTMSKKVASPAEHESDILAALQQGFFLLGDDAKTLTLSVFRRCTDGLLSEADLEMFLDRIWEIHRTDDFSTLPSSDAVARLLAKFGSS